MKKLLYTGLISLFGFSLCAGGQLSSEYAGQQRVDRFAALRAATVSAPSGTLSAVKATPEQRSSLTAGYTASSRYVPAAESSTSYDFSRNEKREPSSRVTPVWGATVSAPSGTLSAVKTTSELLSSLTAGQSVLSRQFPATETPTHYDYSRRERVEPTPSVTPVVTQPAAQPQPTRIIHQTTYVTQPVITQPIFTQPVIRNTYSWPRAAVVVEQPQPDTVYIHHTGTTPQTIHVIHHPERSSSSSAAAPALPSWLTLKRVLIVGGIAVGGYCMWRWYVNQKNRKIDLPSSRVFSELT